MEIDKFDIDEVAVFCKHNFDISDTKVFATALANRFNINIDITERDGVIINSINIPNATTTKNLYCQNTEFDNDFSFVLEFGDEAHCFYKNHLEYHLPFGSSLSDYSNHDTIYEGIRELKMFGADNVYIGNSNELNLSSETKFNWEKLVETILNSNHYIIEL